MTNFEHLELPKANIALPKRPRPYGGGGKRSNRDTHGTKILAQLSNLIQPKDKENSPLGINPKLIFKIKLNKQWNLSDDNLTSLDLDLLAKEPKAMQALVVFSSDNCLQEFKNKLEQYCGKKDGHQYGYLDSIEELVPLEPQDRIGRLLELEPLESGVVTPLDMELWHTGDREEMRQNINQLDEFLRDWEEYPGMEVTDRYIGDYLCIARIKITPEILEILLEEDAIKEIDRRPKPAFESPAQYNIPLSELPPVPSPPFKVINISLGNSELVYQDSHKQFKLAAKIDEIAYRFRDKNILFVISAGNFYYDSISKELLRQDYPNYLLQDEARIIDPATSAIALTVGSLSMGKGSLNYSDYADRNAIAKVEGYPSPFTRTGFGVDEMIKPDLVEFGGDFVLDGKRCIPNEPGVSILTMKQQIVLIKYQKQNSKSNMVTV